MTNNDPYTPPAVWTWQAENGGTFANINRPIAGATHDKQLAVGKHPLQLYSLATPNGVKVTVMLEELLAQNIAGAEYDAWLIQIRDGDQFGSGFVEINPNSKIPALMDHSISPPLRVFESGNILLYLADKFATLIPKDPAGRTECLSWLFWQMGSAPYLGGGRHQDKARFPSARKAMTNIRFGRQGPLGSMLRIYLPDRAKYCPIQTHAMAAILNDPSRLEFLNLG